MSQAAVPGVSPEAADARSQEAAVPAGRHGAPGAPAPARVPPPGVQVHEGASHANGHKDPLDSFNLLIALR